MKRERLCCLHLQLDSNTAAPILSRCNDFKASILNPRPPLPPSPSPPPPYHSHAFTTKPPTLFTLPPSHFLGPIRFLAHPHTLTPSLPPSFSSSQSFSLTLSLLPSLFLPPFFLGQKYCMLHETSCENTILNEPLLSTVLTLILLSLKCS